MCVTQPTPTSDASALTDSRSREERSQKNSDGCKGKPGGYDAPQMTEGFDGGGVGGPDRTWIFFPDRQDIAETAGPSGEVWVGLGGGGGSLDVSLTSLRLPGALGWILTPR